MSPKKFAELRDELYERSPASKEKVARKARELAAQLGLAELRSARERTQVELAEAIGTTQSGVSRIERQQDLLVSTLDDYVTATGGVLHLVASYPDFDTDIDVPVLRSRRVSTSRPREFRVVWQNQETRQFVHVGTLDFDGTRFAFRYTAEAHLDADFEPFNAFPDLHATYDSVELFSFFAERVATSPLDRSLAGSLGLEGLGATPVELLARTWGRSPHDTIQVVPEPDLAIDGSMTRFFLASGVRHVNEADPDSITQRIATLERDTPLVLCEEPDNPFNARAMLLESSGQTVGWVPDYLLDELHKMRDAGDDIQVFVEHSNGPDVGWHLRLLCRMEVRSKA